MAAARDAARNHDLDMGLGGELVHGVGHRLGRHITVSACAGGKRDEAGRGERDGGNRTKLRQH
jgi:hypothetical protein